MSSLSQFGFGGEIKSIQRGVIIGSATATISPVNTSKSILYFLGVSNGTNRAVDLIGSLLSFNSTQSRIELTNSTTITATVGQNISQNNPLVPPTVSWQLVEYY